MLWRGGKQWRSGSQVGGSICLLRRLSRPRSAGPIRLGLPSDSAASHSAADATILACCGGGGGGHCGLSRQLVPWAHLTYLSRYHVLSVRVPTLTKSELCTMKYCRSRSLFIHRAPTRCEVYKVPCTLRNFAWIRIPRDLLPTCRGSQTIARSITVAETIFHLAHTRAA